MDSLRRERNEPPPVGAERRTRALSHRLFERFRRLPAWLHLVVSLLFLTDQALQLVPFIAGMLAQEFNCPERLLRVLIWLVILVLLYVLALASQAFMWCNRRRRLLHTHQKLLSHRNANDLRTLADLPISDVEPLFRESAALLGVLVDQAGVRRIALTPVSLALGAIQSYLHRLQKINQRPLGNSFFFPGTFEIYAFAVQNMLHIVQRDPRIAAHPDSTTVIWTRWSDDLIRWYNPTAVRLPPEGQQHQRPPVVTGHDVEAPASRVWLRSHEWWEKYKHNVMSLRASSAPSHAICRLHRIVHDRTPHSIFVPKGHTAVVYMPADAANNGDTSRSATYWNATDRMERAVQAGNSFVTLLPAVQCALDRAKTGVPEFTLSLLGSVPQKDLTAFQSTCSRYAFGHWVELKEHFVKTYHDADVSGEQAASHHGSGVYCAFLDKLIATNAYDDLFVIERKGEQTTQSDVYGLAFYDDEVERLTGMAFLLPREARQELELLKRLWPVPTSDTPQHG